MSKFDFNLLASLDALLSERNVTAAAHKMGVSQPSMSGMLARLREQLQDPLLVRIGNTYVLTERATELASEVRQALLTIERLVEPSHRTLAEAKRHLRIMASESSLITVMPEVFRRAAVEAPGVTFEIVPISNPVEQVHAGHCDLCLTGNIIAEVTGEVAASIRTATVLTDRLVAVVDRDHPLRDSMSVEQFLSYPHIATRFPGLTMSVEDHVYQGPDAPAARVCVHSFLAIGPSVVGSDMIGLLPERLLMMLPGAGGTRTVDLPEDFQPVTLRTLWHCREDHDLVHRWLRAAIADICSRLSGSSHPEAPVPAFRIGLRVPS